MPVHAVPKTGDRNWPSGLKLAELHIFALPVHGNLAPDPVPFEGFGAPALKWIRQLEMLPDFPLLPSSKRKNM